MKTKGGFSLIVFVICILAISLLTSGGCDISFSSDGDNGGGGGGDENSILQGTITTITPDRSLEGITVRVEDTGSGVFFSDVTDSSGSFHIEGQFSGFPSRLEFLDEGSNLIALTTIIVFPNAEVDLGEITITNGSVNISGDIIVIFQGNVMENNCSGGVGTLEVETDSTTAIVEVSSSTDIIRDSDNLTCEDLLIGGSVEVRGELLVNGTVKADRIELL
jgi:hypothetical protein